MISITKLMDGHDIAQEIRMERQALKNAAFLLLEGDTDLKRFTRYVDEAACSVVNCYGKPNAIEAIELLYEDGFPGALAILDADFDRLTCKLSSHEVIAHPTLAKVSSGRLADSTNRRVSRTEAPLALAVLTTERKAA